MLTINTIHNCDAMTGLKRMPDESVDMVLTSPPYWALRDYGRSVDLIWGGDPKCRHRWSDRVAKGLRPTAGKHAQCSQSSCQKASGHSAPGPYCVRCRAWRGQLGMEPTFECYVQHISDLFDEVRRVLKPTGSCWVNLGDTYSGNKRGKTDAKVHDHVKDAQRRLNKRALIQEKSLCLVPSRLAVEMVHRRWILRNVIIWQKPNCMPASVKDRFTVDFEYLFFFSKSRTYYFEPQLEPIVTRENRPFGIVRERTFQYNTKYASVRATCAWNGADTKQGIPSHKHRRRSGRNKRCVWSIPTRPYRGAHFAPYPEALCETPIRAGCPANGIVLDPFMGSGTTAVVARRLGRSFIGFEPNRRYVEMAKQRLQESLERGPATCTARGA